FLAMADLIHKCYCQDVRSGAMPPNLIGNAHFDIASSSPAGALALMQSRLKLYAGWAQTRGGGLAKWSLKRIGEISGALAGQLPTKFSTDEKTWKAAPELHIVLGKVGARGSRLGNQTRFASQLAA